MSQFAPASPSSKPTANLPFTGRLLTALTWGCVVAGLVMLAVLSQLDGLELAYCGGTDDRPVRLSRRA